MQWQTILVLMSFLPAEDERSPLYAEVVEQAPIQLHAIRVITIIGGNKKLIMQHLLLDKQIKALNVVSIHVKMQDHLSIKCVNAMGAVQLEKLLRLKYANKLDI